jgi:hypothetical protein
MPSTPSMKRFASGAGSGADAVRAAGGSGGSARFLWVSESGYVAKLGPGGAA